MKRGVSLAHRGIVIGFLLCVLILTFLSVTFGPPGISSETSRDELMRQAGVDVNALLISGDLVDPDPRLLREAWLAILSDPPLKTEQELRGNDMTVADFLRFQGTDGRKEMAREVETLFKPLAEWRHMPFALSRDVSYDLYRLMYLWKKFLLAGRDSPALEVLIGRVVRRMWSMMPV